MDRENRSSKQQPLLGTLRVGGASAIPDVLREFGVDPGEVLTEAGLDADLFDDPDNLITYSARDRLLYSGIPALERHYTRRMANTQQARLKVAAAALR